MEFFGEIRPKEAAFIDDQKMFFVATAPLSADGHVNVSPKGLSSFGRLGSNRVAYIDLGGSGIETHSHLRENGRICLMFCAFDGDPLILRIYGEGKAHQYGTSGFDALRPNFRTLRFRSAESSKSLSRRFNVPADGRFRTTILLEIATFF